MQHAIYQREPKWKKVAHFIVGLIFQACYNIGWVVLQMVKVFWPGGKLHRKLQYKLDLWRQRQPGTTLVAFVILALLVVIVFQLANLAATGERLVGRVLGTANTGLSQLSAAKDLLQQQDFNGVNQRLALALQSFQQSQTQLNSNNVILQNLLNLVPQKQQGDDLLQATILLTQAGQEWTQFYQLSQTVKITPQGFQGQNASPTVLQEMNNHLQAGRAKTDQALALLAQVNPNIIPEDKRATFLEVKNNLSAIQNVVDTVGDGVDILYSIVSGQKHLLFLFENDNELRATGGFMGTFGQMDLTNGQINQLHISSIYDLDGQLHDDIAPPLPVRAVNPQWYLRDTNWFTDFAQSAQVISRFYQQEAQTSQPDVIVALTPELVINLLKVSGPITLPRYNVTFTADNFVEMAQVESSVNYDKTLNQPKQVLADFFPTLLQQLSNLSGPQLIPVIGALQQSLLHKSLLLYATDPGLEQKIQAYNWAGTIKDTDRDYLLVSSSNFGGTKTDRSMEQNLKLETTIDALGKITDTLTITRTNPLANQEELRNRSFVRVYVPAGSKLIAAQGFSALNIPSVTTLQSVDPDAENWNQHANADPSTGTIIASESGKTVFGNWLEVRGGETKTVTLTYELPFTLEQLDHYSLLVQKQPGAKPQDFFAQINYPDRKLIWSNLDPSEKENKMDFTATLDQELFRGIIVQAYE